MYLKISGLSFIDKQCLISFVAADDVTKLLKEVGVSVVKEDLDSMMSALSGKKLHELVREGSSKLASVPTGGAGKNFTLKLIFV